MGFHTRFFQVFYDLSNAIYSVVVATKSCNLFIPIYLNVLKKVLNTF